MPGGKVGRDMTEVETCTLLCGKMTTCLMGSVRLESLSLGLV